MQASRELYVHHPVSSWDALVLNVAAAAQDAEFNKGEGPLLLPRKRRVSLLEG